MILKTIFNVFFLQFIILVCHSHLLKKGVKNSFTIHLDKLNRDPFEYHNYLLQKAGNEKLNLRYKYSLYIGKISVGTPPQWLPVLFDTGSEYFYVTSRYCKSNKQCEKVDKFFDNKGSQTYRKLNQIIQQEYPSGKLKASLNIDNVYINQKIISNHILGEIIENAGLALEKEISAIAGLAYKKKGMKDEESLLENIVKSKILKRNIISFNLMDNAGSIRFGSIDHTAIKGNLNKHPLVEKHYWSIKLNDLILKGNRVNLCDKKKFCQLVVDTGTNDISLPKQSYDKVIEFIEVNEDCSNYQTLEPIVFLIDGKEYPLEKEFYVHKFNYKGKAHCSLNIIPLELENEMMILGEPFMKKYYTVFDRDENCVWFASKK